MFCRGTCTALGKVSFVFSAVGSLPLSISLAPVYFFPLHPSVTLLPSLQVLSRGTKKQVGFPQEHREGNTPVSQIPTPIPSPSLNPPQGCWQRAKLNAPIPEGCKAAAPPTSSTELVLYWEQATGALRPRSGAGCPRGLDRIRAFLPLTLPPCTNPGGCAAARGGIIAGKRPP